MKKVLITGARGFLGRNLMAHISQLPECQVASMDKDNSPDRLAELLLESDVIFHLAGVNRPQTSAEFDSGNVEITERICRILAENRRAPKIVFSSSIQAGLHNPYGVSKAKAEKALLRFAEETGACVRIYRLKNLFGKWCRPNYNSVTATFCYNIANELPISISDPKREIELSYVEDVASAFLSEVTGVNSLPGAGEQIRSYRIALGDLAGRIQCFHEMRHTLMLPDFADPFNRALYGTYLSYVPPDARKSDLAAKSDMRGSLAEFIKQEHFGQLFVSRTSPGITRGNHYHHTKTEKFLVVEGQGLIRMRSIEGGPIVEYAVNGPAYQVVDVPPGYTHSISNIGAGEMVTVFWSSEIFNPDDPDTYFSPVDCPQRPDCISLEPA